MTQPSLPDGLRILGQAHPGVCGTWWRAMTPDGGERIALRIASTDPALVERLSAASTAIDALRHGGLLTTGVPVPHNGALWLVAGRATGPTLSELAEADGAGPDAGAVATVAAESARTLAALHAAGTGHGAVHGRTVCVSGIGAVTLTEAGLLPAMHGVPADPAADRRAWAELLRWMVARWCGTAPEAELLLRCATLGVEDLARAVRELRDGPLPVGAGAHTALVAAVAAYQRWSATTDARTVTAPPPTHWPPAPAVPHGSTPAKPATYGAPPTEAMTLAASPTGSAVYGTPPTEALTLGGPPTATVPTVAVPTSGLPTEAIPAGALPTEAIPTGAIPTEAIPTGAIPTEAIPTGAVPTEAIPTGAIATEAIPTGAIPTEAIATGAVPTEAIPTARISTGGTLGDSGALPSPATWVPTGPSAPTGTEHTTVIPSDEPTTALSMSTPVDPFLSTRVPTMLPEPGAAAYAERGWGATGSEPTVTALPTTATGPATTHPPTGTAATPTGHYQPTATPSGRYEPTGVPTGQYHATATPTGQYAPGGRYEPAAGTSSPPAGEVRFGPGVPATPPTAPPWHRPPQPPERPRRSRWRLVGSILSTLLTLALLVVVGLHIWQRMSPLEIRSVRVAVAEPPGERCDVTVDVVATVETNGRAGSITYQWLRGGAEPGGLLTERVARGQRTVKLHLKWSFNGVGSTTETAVINITEPTPTQGRTIFRYQCGPD